MVGPKGSLGGCRKWDRGWANVHIGMAEGKFAKNSHPGLVCAHRVWAGQARWQGKVIWNRQVVLVRGKRGY